MLISLVGLFVILKKLFKAWSRRMANCQTTCLLYNFVAFIHRIGSYSAAKSVLMGRSLSWRQWPIFTKLVRNSTFKSLSIDWYLSLLTYSRGQISIELPSPTTSTTNKGISEVIKLVLVWLLHVNIKCSLKIKPSVPLTPPPLFGKITICPTGINRRSPSPPRQTKQQQQIVRPATELRLAFAHCWADIWCCGEINGEEGQNGWFGGVLVLRDGPQCNRRWEQCPLTSSTSRNSREGCVVPHSSVLNLSWESRLKLVFVLFLTNLFISGCFFSPHVPTKVFLT